MMKYQVDNAVIMAAGLSSRFAPISYEKPKALITVKGEVLIERQIKQLREAGIQQIIIVVGYMKEKFMYLKEKFNIIIVENPDYNTRNNNASIYVVKKYLRNSYICSADNYFSINPFEKEVDDSYYAAVYAEGETDEWCMMTDEDGIIKEVTIGGNQSWYMLGHVFWSEKFSAKFVNILNEVYEKEETKGKLWESIFIEHIEQLPMKIRKYQSDEIYEFDSLDELRQFDTSYIKDSHSEILKKIAYTTSCKESEIIHITPVKDGLGNAIGIEFDLKGMIFHYLYNEQKVIQGKYIESE